MIITNNLKMRHLKILLVMLVAISCTRNVQRIQDSNASLLTGTYHLDSMPGSLLLSSNGLVPEEYYSSLITIDSIGSFKLPITIEYPQSLALILGQSLGSMAGSRAIGLFIFPEDTLNIDISDSVKITCKNKSHQDYIQNYLKLSNLLQKARIGFPFQESVQKDTPSEFRLKQIEFNGQMKELIKTFITKNNIQNQKFNKMAFLEAEYITACHLIDYKWLNKIIYRKEVKVPMDFFSLADSLTKTDCDFIITQNYFDFLNRIQMKYSTEKIDSLLKFINYDPKTLTQEILLGRSLMDILNKDSIQVASKYFDAFKPKIKNSIIKQRLDEEYKAKIAFLDNPSVKNTLLTDLSVKSNKNSVLKQIIEDHKDKVIYVKFWGPWCGPCMEELPFDKMLIKEINPANFAFVNLCVRTKKSDWEFTISNKKMFGYHYLLSNDQYNELSSLFNISGIPYHILIGKDGKILNNNAPSPGSAILGGLDHTFVRDLKRITNLN
jgi:thiol-disulfide isomerase/thioredoxin